jgi:hypothetical protein
LHTFAELAGVAAVGLRGGFADQPFQQRREAGGLLARTGRFAVCRHAFNGNDSPEQSNEHRTRKHESSHAVCNCSWQAKLCYSVFNELLHVSRQETVTTAGMWQNFGARHVPSNRLIGRIPCYLRELGLLLALALPLLSEAPSWIH